MKGDFREKFGRGLVLGGAWTVLAFLILPMVVIFPVSVTDQYYLSLPKDGISLEHYAAFFTNEIWLSATAQSVIIATCATIFAVILGSLCAIGCWRLSTNLSESVRTFMLIPIIVPTIVQALAMYRFWIDLGIIDTYIGVILAHTLVAIPYVIITVSASLANFDLRQEQAARSLGASMPQTIRWVIVPSILPGLLSGALFAFTISFDEIVMVLFITSRAIYTLPKRIWNGIEDHLDPTIAAVATMLIAATLALLLLDLWVRHRRQRRLEQAASVGE
ncbi:MAG: ABC transporter permease [Alphaproteobacteria bacterium]|nr:ABC transporter permease [Alphaproteobacteria bacterium]MBU0798138.1 ABC transporter permease [Alphaproteobacteria bacterium]MBU0887045.1 ABC transporter permease [Alphaproteobacteria bacterium]MBU1814295.1 ABC transporter permease [Alphaproteobacteria bacterium]MBU2089262.1 ABC transporter permease [Alphaproteobacteria bacterium]